MDVWAASLQQVVTGIRNTGATSQIILLPGTESSSLGAFISDGSAAALNTITNPDGSTTNLVFDMHQYLDAHSTGKDAECVSNGGANIRKIATWLTAHGRKA